MMNRIPCGAEGLMWILYTALRRRKSFFYTDSGMSFFLYYNRVFYISRDVTKYGSGRDISYQI